MIIKRMNENVVDLRFPVPAAIYLVTKSCILYLKSGHIRTTCFSMFQQWVEGRDVLLVQIETSVLGSMQTSIEFLQLRVAINKSRSTKFWFLNLYLHHQLGTKRP